MDWTQKKASFDGCIDWSQMQMECLADGLDSERRFGVSFNVGFLPRQIYGVKR